MGKFAPRVQAPEGICFDLDGTLIDSAADLRTAVNHALAAWDLSPISLPDTRRFIGDGLHQLLIRAFQHSGGGALSDTEDLERAVALWEQHYEKCALDQTRLFPGVELVLQQLQEAGIPLALVSNKPEAFCHRILSGLSIKHHFRVVCGGDSCPERKPSPRPLLDASVRMGSSPERSVMIGDGIQDMKAARAGGLRAIAVTWGQGTAELLIRAGAHCVVGSVQQLIPEILGQQTSP